MNVNKRVLLADLALFGIAVGWGYTFVLMKDILTEMTPLYFTGTRFLLAGIIIALFQYHKLKELTWKYWKAGLITGVSLCLAYTLQAFGTDLTTPGKSGVLSGMNVILVPFLYFIWSRMPLQLAPILGSFLAFAGLSVLSWNGGGALGHLNMGDMLILLCAVFFAVHIIQVHATFRKGVYFNPVLFAMVQLLVVGVIGTSLAVLTEPVPGPLSPYGWFAYSFDLIVGTLLAYLVQIGAQKYAPPIHVAVILSLESVFAFLFSWAIWGEPVTGWILLGIFLIVTGIYVTEMKDWIRLGKKGGGLPVKTGR
ncbi:MAG: DMT family transporter [Bacillaceae bacterium]|nr:DMT family transporter [Bacillaceae bacterium]